MDAPGNRGVAAYDEVQVSHTIERGCSTDPGAVVEIVGIGQNILARWSAASDFMRPSR